MTGGSGFRKLEMNALSIPIREIYTQNSTEGKDLKLSIDFYLQKFVMEKMENTTGAVIVMNVKTGEILAYAVYPHYNPNNYRNATQFQIKNWTLTDVLPPGSTFKIITEDNKQIYEVI